MTQIVWKESGVGTFLGSVNNKEVLKAVLIGEVYFVSFVNSSLMVAVGELFSGYDWFVETVLGEMTIMRAALRSEG